MEFAAIPVIGGRVAQFQRFIEEVGGHLVGQEAAAAAVVAHINDDGRDFRLFEIADHAFPQLHRQHIIVGEAVDGDIADAFLQQFILHRQLQAVANFLVHPVEVAVQFGTGGEVGRLLAAAGVLVGDGYGRANRKTHGK